MSGFFILIGTVAAVAILLSGLSAGAMRASERSMPARKRVLKATSENTPPSNPPHSQPHRALNPDEKGHPK